MSIKKAIAAGHICLDITPAFKSKEEKNIKDLFRPGQLIAMDAAKVSLGGSVSNTGVGMKRLGADVELMGMASEMMHLVRWFLQRTGKIWCISGEHDCKKRSRNFLFCNPCTGRH